MAENQDTDEAFDLKFLEDSIAELDQTDAISTRVIPFAEDSEIPTKYIVRKIFSPHLEPPYHYHPAGEKTQRRRQVKSTWGHDASEGRTSFPRHDDILTLLTFEASDNKQIDHKTTKRICEAISKLSRDHKAEALRYNGLQVLMKLHSQEEYEALGKQFSDGKADDIARLKLTEIQAVSVVNPPLCYIELSCAQSDGAKIQRDMSALLVPFCSTFPFLAIREPVQKVSNGTSPTNSPASKQRKLDKLDPSTVPALGLMLMFTHKAQANADKTLSVVKGNPNQWQEVKMPPEISEDDEGYFQFADSNGMLLALKRGSPFAGVRITVVVNRNLEQVERFYTLITGKTPLAYNKIEEGLSCRTYPLSKSLELHLVMHPAVHSQQASHVALCFPIDDINKLCPEIQGGVRNIGDEHWLVTDPDGNSVILYSLLE